MSSLSLSSWWFQPIWKILVKMGIFPNFRGENEKCVSCHHLVMVMIGESIIQLQWHSSHPSTSLLQVPKVHTPSIRGIRGDEGFCVSEKAFQTKIPGQLKNLLLNPIHKSEIKQPLGFFCQTYPSCPQKLSENQPFVALELILVLPFQCFTKRLASPPANDYDFPRRFGHLRYAKKTRGKHRGTGYPGIPLVWPGSWTRSFFFKKMVVK